MKPIQAAKTVGQPFLNSFETVFDQFKPLGSEALDQVSFLGNHKGVSRIPQEMATEDLQRARDQQKLEKENAEDNKESREKAQKVIFAIQQEYREHQIKTNSQNKQQTEQILELQQEIVELAKTAGVKTKAHLENVPQKGKVSLQSIKLLISIVRTLRIKAQESKSAQELVSQRNNAKRTTGMLAWVSGKQMKVHEQGTLQLQG